MAFAFAKGSFLMEVESVCAAKCFVKKGMTQNAREKEYVTPISEISANTENIHQDNNIRMDDSVLFSLISWRESCKALQGQR